MNFVEGFDELINYNVYKILTYDLFKGACHFWIDWNQESVSIACLFLLMNHKHAVISEMRSIV